MDAIGSEVGQAWVQTLTKRQTVYVGEDMTKVNEYCNNPCIWVFSKLVSCKCKSCVGRPERQRTRVYATGTNEISCCLVSERMLRYHICHALSLAGTSADGM